MGVVENMKDVADLVKKYNDLDLNRRIVTLEGEVLDLTRDKRRLEEKLEDLQRALKFKAELIFSEPFYWAKGDATPYCQACWEAKRMAIHVCDAYVAGHGQCIQCPNCKNINPFRPAPPAFD